MTRRIFAVVAVVALLLAAACAASTTAPSTPPAATTPADSHLGPNEMVILAKSTDDLARSLHSLGKSYPCAHDPRMACWDGRPVGPPPPLDYYVTVQLFGETRQMQVSQACWERYRIGDVLPRECRP